MVRMKMEQREYIILCLEDSNDWSNATTRRLVMQARARARARAHLRGICVGREGHMPPQPAARCAVALASHVQLRPRLRCPPAAAPQVDPTLSRTVVVSTKLDTRIPQVLPLAKPACMPWRLLAGLVLLA